MNHTAIKGLAVAAILTMGLAACSSSGSNATSSSSSAAASGKPLVVDDTPLSPMTDTFSPY